MVQRNGSQTEVLGRQGDGAFRLEFLTVTKIALFEVIATSVRQGMLVGVFCSILDIVQQKQLTDYHLKIQNGWHRSQWKVVVLHGDDARAGPVVCSRCMSCDLDCPLKLGATGQGRDGGLRQMYTSLLQLAS